MPPRSRPAFNHHALFLPGPRPARACCLVWLAALGSPARYASPRDSPANLPRRRRDRHRPARPRDRTRPGRGSAAAARQVLRRDCGKMHATPTTRVRAEEVTMVRGRFVHPGACIIRPSLSGDNAV